MIRALLASACLASVAVAGPIEDAMSPEERAVLAELDGEHLIKARDLAEKLLATDSSSFIGAWAMARVHHDEEGNHARALAWVRRAQKLLAGRDRDWGMKAELEEYFLLAEMNENAAALEVLDRYAVRYGEPSAALRIWPLFKLGRNRESREIATRLAASADWDDKVDGYNGMLSIAFEEHDRAESYRWAKEAIAVTQERNCTLMRNAAGTAFTMLRLDEADELATRAAKTKFCIDPVDNMRASLALAKGQFQEVIAALESARSQRIEKRYRPHFALVRRAVLVDLLDAAGKQAEALKLAGDLYGQQQRIGVTSSPPEIERLSRTMRYAYALDGRLTELREQLGYAELPGGAMPLTTELTGLLAKRWEVRRALLQLLAEPERLAFLSRPNLAEPSDWPSWRIGDLTPVVGVGVMRAAIARARELDAATPAASGYLDALEAEVAYRAGDLEEAVTLSDRALGLLAQREALWRWRLVAWRADALTRLGRKTEGRAALQETLQRWPTALRMFDVRVPVTVATDGSALATETAARLKRSTRFETGENAPFRLAVEARGPLVEICLRDEFGAQLSCGSGEGATAALEAFHGAAFSPRISLTQSDLRSLDGSPVRVGADTALKKLLVP